MSVHGADRGQRKNINRENDLDAGARAYIEFIAIDTTPNDGRANRFAEAWRAADVHDDPAEFVHELHRAGYFTAPEASYTRGVVSLYRGYLAPCEAYARAHADATSPTPSPDVSIVNDGYVLGAVALSLDRLAKEYFDQKGADVKRS